MAKSSVVRPAAFQHDRTTGSDAWLTPKAIVDALDLPHLADVDPCSPPRRPWPTARRHVTKAQDGLARWWDPEDFFWVNPPYGAECRQWMAKTAAHGNGLLLVFARTDTQAFHESVWRHPNAKAVFFFVGRLRFATVSGHEAGSAGAPSALVAYGRKAQQVLEDAVHAGSLRGRLVPLSDAGKSNAKKDGKRGVARTHTAARKSVEVSHSREAAQRPARDRSGRAS